MKTQATAAASAALDDVGMTPFLKRVTVFSCGGPFLDGYVLALIGVALTQMSGQLELSGRWVAAIGAAALLGILVGAVVGGWITDKVGRRFMFTLDIAAIVACSVLSALVDSPLWITVLRFALGFFVGADYPIATSLIAEFTPKRYRAVSMGSVSAAWYVGATTAALVGFGLFSVAEGWRWMLASAALPGVALLIGRWGIPESPRWLARHGRRAEAESIVRGLFGTDVVLEAEPEHQQLTWPGLFSQGYCRRVVFVAIMISCQVVPMFAIYTFGPAIMEAFGLASGHQSILGETVISALFLIGTVPAMFWLGRFGRRPVLIGSLAVMTAALAVLALFSGAPVGVIIVAFGLYAFFAGGPGILQWLYPNELFPTAVRASAVGLALGVSRIATIVSTYILPLALGRFGIGPVMGAMALLTAVGLAASARLAPETNGRSLVDAASLGVR
ncbi:MAG: MFS transporter [Bifidobacteriaceae bacterium]|jgi:putative MFS transporter|nr:MFS transporter [Bifidobacteriaceae bacterium]